MKIINGNVFLNKEFVKCDLEFGSKINAIGSLRASCEDLNAEGCYVIPGFIDVHTHGCINHDFSDGNPEGLQVMSDYYASHGVTGFLATTMTIPESELLRACETVKDFSSKPFKSGKCLGIHLEGPFLSASKKGAMFERDLLKPDIAMFHRLNEASGNRIKQITVAPEEPGGIDFIKEISKICTVSVGHTIADYDKAAEAFRSGSTHATHLYNGMLSLLHRAPGVIGAARDCGAYVELICDGYHIHPSVIRATFAMFGDKVVLISDSLRSAGMPDGHYELGNQEIIVKDQKATLLDGTIAGSSITVLDAVRNCVNFGIKLEDAVYAGTTAPAKADRLEGVGEIKVGTCADILVLDKELNLLKVFIDGREWTPANQK